MVTPTDCWIAVEIWSLSVGVSGSVCDQDRVLAGGGHDRLLRPPAMPGAGDGVAELVGVGLGGLAGGIDDGVLRAALELDAEVEAPEVEAERPRR